MRRKLKPFSVALRLEDAASDGWAVARHEGRVVFVEQGVPGDLALVEVFKKQKKQLIGRIQELREPSPDRITPRCTHFGTCGGCKWQMMRYEAQLVYKEKQVLDAFERVAKVEPKETRPILGVEDPYFYRNKLEFTFSNKAWLTREQIDSGEEFEQRVLGFHKPRMFDKIIDIDTCYLQTPLVNDIRNATRQLARQHGWSFYDIRANEGLLRNLLFRTTHFQQQLMLVLILGEERPEVANTLFETLKGQFPQITHFAWIHNPKKNSSYADLPFHAWGGEPFIVEQLGQYKFQISPTSFFQTNSRQAQRLYELVQAHVIEALPEGAKQHDLIYDLYAGTGSIGIFNAHLARHIVGIEYVESSVKDAQKNLALNGLEHFSFYAGDMKQVLGPDLVEKEGHPRLVIADPPRAGMDPKVVQRLLEIAPEYLIYVSCKPGTQARDVALMKDAYELLCIQPVDMFPQTAHVENVAFLKRKSG